jgi:hypothetical protein
MQIAASGYALTLEMWSYREAADLRWAAGLVEVSFATAALDLVKARHCEDGQ